MPDETTDQAVDLIPGAEEAPIEAPAGVVDAGVEPVAGEAAPVPESPVSFDLTSDDGIKAALEANPTLAGYIQRQAADAANTARQRRDAEIRREQGTVDVARAYTRQIAQRIANGEELEAIEREVPFYVKANHDTTRLDYARALLQHAAEGDETAKGLLDSLTGDPDEAIRVAQVALDATVKRARSEEAARVRAELEAEYAKKLEAELNAARVETQVAGRTNPPNVQGTQSLGGGVTWESIDKQYTDAEWTRLPAETRKQLSDQANAAQLSVSRS